MHEFVISPAGRPALVESPAGAALPAPLVAAFADSAAHGLLRLATADLQTRLPAPLEYGRDFASAYLAGLCRTQGHEASNTLPPTPPPSEDDLAARVLRAPPMTGLEYLGPDTLAGWWSDLDALVRAEIRARPGGAQAYLSEKNPLWRFVGRVALHLAENKRDPEHPFAFLATYVSGLSPQGTVQHEPLSRALAQYAGAKNRDALLGLLAPLQRAAERSPLVRELVDSGDVYHALAWTAREAHGFLQAVPALEESGLVVRVPDWWNPQRPARVAADVKIGASKAALGVDAILDFSVTAALDGEPLTEAELEEILRSDGGLVRLKGRWVELDRRRLEEALAHWRAVEAKVRRDGLTFFEGMRLLSGAALDRDAASEALEAGRDWAAVSAGPALKALLERLGPPEGRLIDPPAGLRAELRPYQREGLGWLRFLTRLGLGACLADDMGLGKTVQVIALLLALKDEAPAEGPSLLVVPASLIANWKAELQRFAPSLTFKVAHPSEMEGAELPEADIAAVNLVITTYGVLTRQEALRKRVWRLAILDEAQAIKNPGTKQTKSAKEIRASARIALTGTPVENRLGDLWSLFDFLNPGLLGGAKAFGKLIKQMEAPPAPSYKPLRSLAGPYILRRLKTDKRVIADLPDKTEVTAWCGLTRPQAALYAQEVRELEEHLGSADGMERRGVVLAQLMRLKQICNHPAQLLGHGEYDMARSGKFQRLAALAEEMAQRQERALIFTQFREVAEPLAGFLAGIFGRPGLVLHGGTPVPKRRGLVEEFQREGGPPFFVLSVKAGGTGLNLTAASQVIHFDRWWNPAVENQATDRAFRIGQKKNVLVHKFVCRGTVEERIDRLIAEKAGLARDVVEGGEVLLTEMPDAELLAFVALDIHKALGTE